MNNYISINLGELDSSNEDIWDCLKPSVTRSFFKSGSSTFRRATLKRIIKTYMNLFINLSLNNSI